MTGMIITRHGIGQSITLTMSLHFTYMSYPGSWWLACGQSSNTTLALLTSQEVGVT